MLMLWIINFSVKSCL